MFEREPKVKPVHIQETSFLKIHDLVQQDKDNQSNSHKGKKEMSTFVNAIQKTKKTKNKKIKSWLIVNSLSKFFMQP